MQFMNDMFPEVEYNFVHVEWILRRLLHTHSAARYVRLVVLALAPVAVAD